MSFYVGRYAELYDLFYKDKPYIEEARFVYERLCFHGGAAPTRILEIACGTGTHALELAKNGCTVTATDCSSGMLEVAKRKGKESAGPVTFSECDMRALPKPETPYDAVICLFDSIGYVESDENLAKVFGGVRESLKNNGLFLFEYWHEPPMTQKFERVRVKRVETDHGTFIRISETGLNPDRRLASVKYDIYELTSGGTYMHFSETQSNRYFTVREMNALAKKHGFMPLAVYSGFAADEAITDETWHVVAVWRTRGRQSTGSEKHK